MIVRNFKLHLTKGKSVPLLIHANQYDSGEKWVFSLFNDDGTKYVPSSGAIVGIKADNKGIINTGSIEGDDVVINETSQMTAAPGKAEFELLIDDQTHGTANFFVLVEPKPGDNADLSESDYSLFQEAIEGTSAAAIAQGVADWMDENLTPTTPVVDASLTVQGAAADAKKTGDEINDLKSQIQQIGGGIPTEVKRAMDTLLQNVAMRDDSVYSDEFATIHAWATAVNVLSISAVFTQGANVIYDTDDLDDLRPYLTVTASFDDSTTSEISAYTLSGTLEEGSCTITATYEGKTATFNVTVTHSPVPSGYTPLDYLSSNIDGSPSSSKLTKTPYIKTGFPASDTDILNYTVKLVYECNFNSVTAIPFGGRNATGSTATRGCVVNLASDETVFNFGIKSGSTTLIRTALGYGITKDEKHTIEIKNGNISLDGTQVAQTDATSAVQLASYKWALFGRNNGGSYNVSTSGDALSPMIGKIYEFSIKDGNGDYVLNYVPSMRKSDSVYGMYDTVSDTFYTSANSYSFIGGND